MPNSNCVLAAGYVEPDRQIIHGKKLPPDHVCVLLTTAQPKIEAPLVAGDEDENFFWKRGSSLPFQKIAFI